jgi:hypothetical protein
MFHLARAVSCGGVLLLLLLPPPPPPLRLLVLLLLHVCMYVVVVVVVVVVVAVFLVRLRGSARLVAARADCSFATTWTETLLAAPPSCWTPWKPSAGVLRASWWCCRPPRPQQAQHQAQRRRLTFNSGGAFTAF